MIFGSWNQWIPILDQSEKKENIWIIGLTEDQINCISMKSNEISPNVIPRPVPTTISFKIPLLSNFENHHLEEQYLRERLFTNYKEEISTKEEKINLLKQKVLLDTYLIKLITNSINSEKPDKAYNLCEYLQFQKPLEGIIKLASSSNRGLATQMNKLLEKKFLKK